MESLLLLALLCLAWLALALALCVALVLGLWWLLGSPAVDLAAQLDQEGQDHGE